MKKSLISNLMLALMTVFVVFLFGCKNSAPKQIHLEKEYLGVGVNATTQIDALWENKEDLTFTSSSPNIATVDEQGKITGISLGEATITINSKSKHDVKTICKVAVNDGKYNALTGQESLIKWEGRTFTSDYGVACYNTASGLTVGFYGTSLTAEITSAGQTEGEYQQTPAICYFCDNMTSSQDNLIYLTKQKQTKTYTIIEGLPLGFHTVRICKTTEAYSTSIAFSKLNTDGYFTDRPIDKKYYIEVYGDSITVGMQNLRETEDELTYEGTQNGCLTYCFQAAERLKADISVVARSGIGLYTSYGAPFTLEKKWNKTYLSEYDFLSSTYTNPDYIPSRSPDVIIINIGTNDFWDNWRKLTFEAKLIDLCLQMINLYGKDTKLVIAGNMMIVDIEKQLLNVTNSLVEQGVCATYLKLSTSSAGHPRLLDHYFASLDLVDHLKTVLEIQE